MANAFIATDFSDTVTNTTISDTAANGPLTAWYRKRTASAIVQSGDNLGKIEAYGWDGNSYALGGKMGFYVDGTPADGADMPTRWELSLSPDGSATPGLALKVDSAKKLWTYGAIDAVGIISADHIAEHTGAHGVQFDHSVGIGVTPLQRFHVGAANGGYPAISQTNYDYVAGSVGTEIAIRTGATSGDTFGILTVGITGGTVPGDFKLLPYGGGIWIAKSDGKIGFFGATPVVKPTITGSRGSNAALASFLTALATMGFITDSTS